MSEHVAIETPPSFTLAEAAREIANGITSAFVLVALMLPLGLIAFGHVEHEAIEASVRAALAAALFGNITAVVLGAPLLPNEVPRASTVFVFAAFTMKLASDGVAAADIMVLAALCLIVSGVVQVLFGLLRLGNLARFVPYPVIAGLMTGLAIKLIIYEIPEMLGTHEGGAHGAAHAGFNPWPALLAAFTIVIVIVARTRWPNAPAKLVGVALGTALAVLLGQALGVDVGGHVPALGHEIPAPDALAPLFSHGLDLVRAHGAVILVAAPTIALVGSLDSLVAAVGESDGPLDTTHKPNRLLMALGLGNVTSGIFGGVPLAYSSHHSMATHRAAASTKIVGSIATTLTLVALLRYGSGLVQLIPVAVLSGIMAMLAFGLIDRWASAMLSRARRRQYDAELWLNLLVVALVAGMTAFGLIEAVVTGLVLSMALFIGAMNRSLLRSVATGLTRASRRVYPTVPASVLRAEGHRIRVLEIDGAIFFGTADRLAAEVLRNAEGASYVILDLRRVTMIDASGALMLERVRKRLQQMNMKLLLAHVSTNGPLGRALEGAGVFDQKHHSDWFADSDRALEWAERQLLAEAHLEDTRREMRLAEFSLFAGVTEAQLERVKPYLDRQLFPPRAALFREGDRCDRVYLLARGAVSVMAVDPSERHKQRRVLTLAPGVMFGETAMLTEGKAMATALTEEESVTYTLSRHSLNEIRALDRDLYEQLLQNMLSHLAGLLRMTTGVLRESTDAAE